MPYGLTQLNRWILIAAGGQGLHPGGIVNVWYNQDCTIYGVNPNPGPQVPDDTNIVTVYQSTQEFDPPGSIVLQCGGGQNAYAYDVLDDIAPDYGRIYFQFPDGTWSTDPAGAGLFMPIPAGDGYFYLGSSEYDEHNITYVTVESTPDAAAGNCYPLTFSTGDTRVAARFTAIGLDRPIVLDFLQFGQNASGLSFAGVSLANANWSGKDLSGCDFRGVEGSLSGCVLGGAKLQDASFAGLHVDGLNVSNADCTHADFSGCDFSSFVPGSPPPLLGGADLTGAVIPGGNPWSGANMPDAVLAEAKLTGCDLSNANLRGANFSGTGVAVFSPTYHSDDGIDGYDLADPAFRDRIIAFDYDGNPGQAKPDYLVCYRPGTGAVFIVQKQGEAEFGNVYAQGDPGNGIGGYKLDNPADQIIAFDYNSTGNLDHLVCYQPGAGIISIIEKKTDANNNVTFDKAWDSASGIGGSGGCDLGDVRDRVIAYDYYGTGHLDHLICYRPGTGKLWIIEKDTDQNNNVTFNPVFTSTRGIGGYDLGSPTDQIIAYDYESTGNLDHLVCYRPGGGAIFILRKTTDANNNVTFSPPLYAQGYPGDGIAGFNLLGSADRIIAFDYQSTGHPDHLLCYRPGIGTIWIIQKHVDQNKNVAFTPVYSRLGIGGYDLIDSRDQVIAYDYAGTGKLDRLVCYRPGTGIISIIESRPAQPAVLGPDPQCKLTNANVSFANLAGTPLAGVDLTGASLAGTDFTGIDLTEVTFSFPLKRSNDPNNPTIFTKCKLPYAVIKLDWSYLDLTSATIVDLPTDLTGLCAKAVRLAGVNFSDFILDGADFSGATLDRAHFTGAKLRQSPSGEKPSFAETSLIGAYFSNAVLDQASFAGATLGGIEKNEAAGFSSAWISNCDFTGANAYGAIFAGATLVSGNTLTGVANLEQSDFSNAYLPYADLTSANLQGAKFDGACMIGCVLTNAQLTPAEHGAVAASLTSACLQAAIFDGTQLGGADLTNAAVTDAGGSFQVTHYDQDGNLIGPDTINWKVSSFPSPESFTDETVCPSGDTYDHNKDFARLMMASKPPTDWKPTGTRRVTGPPSGGSCTGRNPGY